MSPPMEPKELRMRLDAVVMRRNQIVPEGDYRRLERPRDSRRNVLNATEHGQTSTSWRSSTRSTASSSSRRRGRRCTSRLDGPARTSQERTTTDGENVSPKPVPNQTVVASRDDAERTKTPVFQRLRGSPPSDSNRRPPPYHGALGRGSAGSRGHQRVRIPRELGGSDVSM
jgi:hypothetical protein